MTVVIRDERPGDAAAVRDVNQTAFGTGTEAALVDVLRRQVASCMSLVAEIDGQVVGHIIFSPVILGTDAAARIMGLGPMSVLPGHQRRGIDLEMFQGKSGLGIHLPGTTRHIFIRTGLS